MAAARDIPIPYRIVALVQERNRLFSYPPEQVACDIWSAKFRCDCCGACCTRQINNHIFLLDRDMAEIRKIDPAAMNPLLIRSSATRTACCMFQGMPSV